MSELDVLNPNPAMWEADIQDSMTPNFNFSRKRMFTRGLTKAEGGVPYTRETVNNGHSFTVSWVGRTWKCAQRLKKWYEQYEDGYFTIIDWGGGGRYYTVRFGSEVNPVEVGNDQYDTINVLLEEVPTVPLLKYPHDWKGDGVIFYVSNDYGDQKLAVSGAWVATPGVYSGRNRNTMDNAGATAGDWAQYQYRGYGFRLWLRKGPTYGSCGVYLDGTHLQDVSCTSAADQGPQMVFVKENVPLDFHRVKVVVSGGAAPTKVSWYALEVMR